MTKREALYHKRTYKAYGYKFFSAPRLGLMGFDADGKTNFGMMIPKRHSTNPDGSKPKLKPLNHKKTF
jgi:hypothetical protein